MLAAVWGGLEGSHSFTSEINIKKKNFYTPGLTVINLPPVEWQSLRNCGLSLPPCNSSSKSILKPIDRSMYVPTRFHRALSIIYGPQRKMYFQWINLMSELIFPMLSRQHNFASRDHQWARPSLISDQPECKRAKRFTIYIISDNKLAKDSQQAKALLWRVTNHKDSLA